MIRHTVLPFKLERTDETLTAHGGVALLAEYNHGRGLRTLTDQCLAGAGRPRGYAPSMFVATLVLLLQAGGRTLEDLRELEREAALRSLLDHDGPPRPCGGLAPAAALDAERGDLTPSAHEERTERTRGGGGSAAEDLKWTAAGRGNGRRPTESPAPYT